MFDVLVEQCKKAEYTVFCDALKKLVNNKHVDTFCFGETDWLFVCGRGITEFVVRFRRSNG